MARVDFVISNSRHHHAMFMPVVRALQDNEEVQCRIVSLCEFRGLTTPTHEYTQEGVEVHRLVPFQARKSTALGRQSGRSSSALVRQAIRYMAWRLWVGPAYRLAMRKRPDLVVLPNDAAYPYDRICRRLRRAQVPFLLVQEGVRFELPAAQKFDPTYGKGGADALAVWGESSSEHFTRLGVPAERIHLTGSPRFDEVLAKDYSREREELRARLRLSTGARVLLFLSNPVDDQGFCTTREKLELFRRFVDQIQPKFEDPRFHLVVKLHGRECEDEFERSLDGVQSKARIHIVGADSLYALFGLADAAVILASTVGLEALLFGLPVAVLELPGVGHVHDYVDQGAALGLEWRAPLDRQVTHLLNGWANKSRDRVEDYLNRTLSRANSSEKIAGLARQLWAASSRGRPR